MTDRVCRRCLLAVAAVLASVLLAEGALRVLGLPGGHSDFSFVRPDLEVGEVFADLGAAVVPDPELFWTLDPSLGSRLANRHGLRGWWPSRAKGTRDLRVVCVGDSCTFGTSVRYEDTYGVRVESELQQRLPDRCVESVLLAVPGYSTLQDRLLCERHLAALEPDVTLLYCGAWNDYLPAVSVSDAERYASNTSGAPRLWRLLERLSEPATIPEEDLKQAFREGRAPRGRRVPLEEFRANVEAMVALASAGSSQVVLIVPPLPEDTEQRYPVSLEYRAVLHEIATDRALALIDGPKSFAAARGDEPLFHDWVHPTATGHALIAADVLSLIEDRLPVGGQAPEGELPVIDGVAPRRMAALTTQRFEIVGHGFTAINALDRVWVGRRWIEEFEVHGDDRISFAVTRPMPMGQHAIELRTQRGVVRGPDALVVEREPLPLQAELRGVGAERGLVLSGRGPADCVVGVWLAPAVLPAPFDSGYGPWHLETDLTGQVSGALRLDQLRLFAANGQTDHRGGWQIAIDLVEASSALGSDAVFAQAILADRFDPTLACFTAPVRVDLTR